MENGMARIKDASQTWWEIICTYDGTPGSWALAAGSTAEEAEASFRCSLANPELAEDLSLKRMNASSVCETVFWKMSAHDA
jgi:hypothetical protein